MQTAPGRWHSAAQVRQKLNSAVEHSLVEYVLKLAGNHCTAGWTLFRQAAASVPCPVNSCPLFFHLRNTISPGRTWVIVREASACRDEYPQTLESFYMVEPVPDAAAKPQDPPHAAGAKSRLLIVSTCHHDSACTMPEW